MLDELNGTNNVEIRNLLSKSGEIYLHLTGKHPEGYNFDVMYVFWRISARHIENTCIMYDFVRKCSQ